MSMADLAVQFTVLAPTPPQCWLCGEASERVVAIKGAEQSTRGLDSDPLGLRSVRLQACGPCLTEALQRLRTA